MVQEDTGAPNEDATCARMAADEAVGCACAFLMMWWSSRRLFCRRRPKPGRRVNDISLIPWSQHLRTTQSERHNGRATRLAYHPASIMPIILPLSNCDSCSYCLTKRRNDISTIVNDLAHSKLWLPVLYSTENDVKRPLLAIPAPQKQESHVAACIVIHKNEVWAHGTTEQTHMGKKYVLTIAIPGYRPSIENVEISSPVQHNVSPDKNSRTTVMVSFLDVLV
ncbi:uncharacterized protein TNCV_2539251 [Trichonephila clavipes]|nr:uncharacterized protein TNCV_2539251 [Trichonephila clavipes]